MNSEQPCWSRFKESAARAFILVAIFGGSWLLPPMMHKTLHYCPVRPDGVGQAEAVPAFARKYGVSCSQCHAGFPVLNAYGRAFKEAGYVRTPGSDEGVLQSEDKQLWTEKIFPWGLIVRSRPFDNGKGTVTNQGAQMGATINNQNNNTIANMNPNGFKSQPINDVDFFVAGGDVARKLSWFGEVDSNLANVGSAPSSASLGLSDLKLAWHPSQYAHLVLARRGFFVDDPYQTISGAESPTIMGRATDRVLKDQSGISGYQLTATQQTAYVYGRVSLPQSKDSFNSPMSIYYALGAAKNADNGVHFPNPTNAYARLAFDSGRGWMLGTFGTYGHTGPFDASAFTGRAAANLPAPGDFQMRKQFAWGGFDALWEIGDFAARSAYLYTHESDPSHDITNVRVPQGVVASDRAFYAELAYYYKRNGNLFPFLAPILRENWYTTFNGTQKFNYVTFQLAHYFAANWRIFSEFSWDTRRDYQNGTLADPQHNNIANDVIPPANNAVRAFRGNRATIQMEVGF